MQEGSSETAIAADEAAIGDAAQGTEPEVLNETTE